MCDPIQSTLSTPAIESHLFLPSRLRPLGRPRWALTSQSLVAPAGQQGRRVNSSDRVTDLLAMLPVLAGQAGLGSPCPTRPAKARTPAQEPGDPSTAQMPCPQCPLFHAAFSQASTWPPSFPAKEGYQTRPLPRPGPCTAACRASPVTPTLPSELEGPGPSEPTVLTQTHSPYTSGHAALRTCHVYPHTPGVLQTLIPVLSRVAGEHPLGLSRLLILTQSVGPVASSHPAWYGEASAGAEVLHGAVGGRGVGKTGRAMPGPHAHPAPCGSSTQSEVRNSGKSPCLRLLSTKVTGACHHTW